ncbi:pseudouridine-5'-phosphate glycosidase [Petrotoga sp. 9PWA.NaAc.5.4]|uniref:pseudouridine-5'-phosphate glycosidase n=1 Tax=Petrotoga sp. 9PWA.NaAc.5.4 TaxID=1434328 RepID=UPI000CB0FBAC|nr:pseudouridine-5'-phosphate glycosidase [Petrotoga sp. 9PWA.NaAc.5.4]PNR96273.1 pseudouridine-5'-phosphate glycosidase [Petrotoga sp. 9PWA.NaAc.5.4]
MQFYKYLEVKDEVFQALEQKKPIVALESTIISHGMPYPENITVAKNVENIIRSKGATPATIAIINGKIKVGLTEEELEFMGSSKDVLKASRMDLPVIIAKRLNAATTVAATMIISNLADIRVFVTGGIGGVHRKAQQTFDISADLQELAKTNIAVVCAGPKAILDLELTKEYLETFGVPLIGYQTDEIPSFYSRRSGIKVPYRIDSAKEAGLIMKAKWDLGLQGGILIANPIPEKYSMDKETINKIVDQAINEAEDKGIKGKELTPFLLSKIKELTKGESLEANIELILNNAIVGAEIAIEYNKLGKQ